MTERVIQKLVLENGKVPFDDWFQSLRDFKMQAAIDSRLARVRAGNFGDCKHVGAGVFELRINAGPGLRIYSGEYRKQTIVLLGGGDKAPRRAIYRKPSGFGANGWNSRNMRLKDYRIDLLERLKNPEYAAQYLAHVLAEKDHYAFLIALRDVVEASGGMGAVAKKVGVKRPSLYKALSKSGNPRFETLLAILDSLGLRMTIAAA